MPLSIDLFMIVASGLEKSWLADFGILRGQDREYKPVASLFRGRDLISTSILPGKTELKTKDSENDSLGRY